MTLFGSAMMAGLATFLILIINFGLGYAQLIRPIVTGAVVGLFLGDVTTGVIIGASLEVIYLGIVNVGGTQATDPFMATVIATSFAIVSGMPNTVAITLALPIGYIGLILFSLEYMLNTLVMPYFEKLIIQDKMKQYSWSIILLQVATQIVWASVVVIAVAFGGDVVSGLIEKMPEFVLIGIDAVGAMLPAIGLAMLINLMWSGKMAFYFFIGFAVMIYLEIPILFLAISAAFIAFLVISLKPSKQTQMQSSQKTLEEQNEEEAFFA